MARLPKQSGRIVRVYVTCYMPIAKDMRWDDGRGSLRAREMENAMQHFQRKMPHFPYLLALVNKTFIIT